MANIHNLTSWFTGIITALPPFVGVLFFLESSTMLAGRPQKCVEFVLQRSNMSVSHSSRSSGGRTSLDEAQRRRGRLRRRTETSRDAAALQRRRDVLSGSHRWRCCFLLLANRNFRTQQEGGDSSRADAPARTSEFRKSRLRCHLTLLSRFLHLRGTHTPSGPLA